MAMNFRNPKYNGRGTIDIEIEHPVHGWIPFTAQPDDPEEHGRELHALAVAAGPAEYEPPSDEERRATMRPLTKRQLKLGLLQNGITPKQVSDTIDAIPDANAREVAKIEWEDATQYLRTHPLITQVGASLGLTDEQIDTMWEAAKEL